MHTIDARTIAVTTHGRFLVRAGAPGAPVLVGFHGYAESADVHLARLAGIPGTDRWTITSLQGLHRFYRRRSDEVVASWMTRQDRDLMISDNVAYVSAVVESLGPDAGIRIPTVYAGFSQGVAMAFRAGCLGARRPSAIVALGGDVPPELDRDELGRSPRVLLGRGRDDPFYTVEMFTKDAARLAAAGVTTEPVVVSGAHEWNAAFAEAVGVFLESVR